MAHQGGVSYPDHRERDGGEGAAPPWTPAAADALRVQVAWDEIIFNDHMLQPVPEEVRSLASLALAKAQPKTPHRASLAWSPSRPASVATTTCGMVSRSSLSTAS